MSIYQEIILSHYKNPHHWGKLTEATNHANIANSSCGDKFEVGGIIESGNLADFRFSGEGCAISIATASMLSDYAIGKKITDLRKLDVSFILNMLGIELSPNRLKCALLPLEALHKLLNI